MPSYSHEEYAFEYGPSYLTTTSQTSQVTVGRVEELDATLGVHAFYKTTLAGNNNDLVWIDRVPGTSTASITYTDPSTTGAALSITVSGADVTVHLATDASGGITTLASDITNYVNNNVAGDPVEAKVAVANAGSDTGVGAVTALSKQSFVVPQGSSPTLDVKLQSSLDGGSTWLDVGSFAQQTTVGKAYKILTGLGTLTRWNLAVGGTSPQFALSITTIGKEEV